MTNFDSFQYTFRSYDMPDLEDESKDLFDAKDKQLENHLNTQSSSLNTEITNINNTLATKADQRSWTSWLPSMTRGGINVPISATSRTYSTSNNVVFVNCEAQITTSVSFPGNQILRFGLPIFAQPSTRVLGHGMFQWEGVFYYCLAFIEGTSGGLQAVFLPDRGQPWLGQTLAGNPTISGNPLGNNFYMNLTYRFS